MAGKIACEVRGRHGTYRLGRTNFLFLICDTSLVLYCRGWPTSVVLLLLMIVAKLSLPLSRHPSLSRHHRVGLVGAARGLVSLRSIEVLQVGARVAGARVAKLQGMRSRPMSRCNSTIYMPISTNPRAKAPPSPQSIFKYALYSSKP